MVKENSIMIGLEIHGYLDTKEKLFCNCKNFHDMKIVKPNTNICPICTGQPGAKPMLPNKSAINKLIQIGLMLNCKINNKKLFFQRKHYNWPDMPYGYQKTISGAHSNLPLENGEFLGIRIREIHLEEDPAAWNPETGKIDYNRAGVPLIEIVTEPDFNNKEDVEKWLRQLILTLSYIKALNKDAGIKADVNVNIKGKTKRTEIKNVNSVSEIIKAIDSEIIRHEKELPNFTETRRWNSIKNKTQPMRKKEEQKDYRFIPEPDLPFFILEKNRTEKIKNSLPESPLKKLDKILKKHKIKKQDAEVLIKNLDIVELFEKVVEKINPKIALPWITVEWLSVLNYNKKNMDDIDINHEHFIELLDLLEKNKITPLKGKEILRRFFPKSFSPIKEAKKSEKITNKEELREIIKNVLKKNKKSVEDYKKGEKKAFNFLIGEIMKETKKRADIFIVRKILKKEIEN